MREEKKFLTQVYAERLNAAPYFIVADYTGLNVPQFNELRARLRAVEAEIHVVKNSLFRIAAQEAGVGELNGTLAGQLAVVTGAQDIAGAAKVVKTFAKEFDKPSIKLGYAGDERLDEEAVNRIADLPSFDVLRSQLLGTLQAPTRQLVTIINTPATQLARVIKLHAEKEGGE